MPTLNVNIDTIVVQTAAQWAVDATVYINRQILVTSDAYYGSTDFRKFKIADGVQAWANIQDLPFITSASQTLAQVLAAGNTTGANNIVISDGQVIQDVLQNQYIDFGSGDSFNVITNNGQSVYIDVDETSLMNGNGGTFTITDLVLAGTGYYAIRPATNIHNVKGVNQVLDFTNVNLVNETASLILSTDASKNIKGLATTTYPSLTELAYVKGVTSAIQTQLNGKEPAKGLDDNYVTDAQLVVIGNTSNTNTGDQTTIVGITGTKAQFDTACSDGNFLYSDQQLLISSPVFGSGTNSSPADGSVFYLGKFVNAAPSATSTNRQTELVVGVLRSGSINILTSGTLGTGETITFELLNITDAVTTSLAVLDCSTRTTSVLFTGVSLTTISAKQYAIKCTSPAWATNPTLLQFNIQLEIFNQ